MYYISREQEMKISETPDATEVEVYRDKKLVFKTKVSLQETSIYFDDVDINVSDTVKAISLGKEYKILSISSQPIGKIILYKKARIEEITGSD
jgi:hypothetical protein